MLPDCHYCQLMLITCLSTLFSIDQFVALGLAQAIAMSTECKSELGQPCEAAAQARKREQPTELIWLRQIHRSRQCADELAGSFWRGCKYLSVGTIYSQDNPLLKEPLKPEHIKTPPGTLARECRRRIWGETTSSFKRDSRR